MVRWLICILAGPFLVSACDPFSSYPKTADDDAGPPAKLESTPGPDAAVDSGGCELASVPRRPDAGGTDADANEFVVAIRRIDLGATDAAQASSLDFPPNYLSFGFDLDGRCSSTKHAGNACITPSWSIDRIDGPGGRDNSVGEFYAMLGDLTAANNAEISAGTLTTIIRVRGYNGEAYDDRVRVEWFAATTVTHAGGAPTAAAWDGHDPWIAFDLWDSSEPAADAGADAAAGARDPVAKYYDDRAYVTDHKLVARAPELLVPSALLSHAVMTASIAKVAGGWVLRDGSMGGRLRIDAALRTIELFREANGQPVCTNSPSYRPRKMLLCSFADVSFTGPDDGTEPCDAASFQWRFSADPAELAGVVGHAGIVAQLPCPPEVSTLNDTCTDLP